MLDANIIRNIITNIFHFNVGFFEVLLKLIYSILESKIFDSKIEYISFNNTSKKPTLKWNIFVIILRIILASNKALKNKIIFYESFGRKKRSL